MRTVYIQRRMNTLYMHVYTLYIHTHVGWLQLVGSSKLYVSFAEYHLFYRALLQQRSTILRSLLIAAPAKSVRSLYFVYTYKTPDQLYRYLPDTEDIYVKSEKETCKEMYIPESEGCTHRVLEGYKIHILYS